MVIYGAFLGDWGPGVGSLGSQMVDLGCQDTDWVGENDRHFRCNFTAGQPPSSHFEHGQTKLDILGALLDG